jgi:hypothetical protein
LGNFGNETIKSPTFVKAASAIAIAGAMGWSGFHFFQSSRHVVLLVYFLLFAVSSYFVAIFRGRARDVALGFAAIVLGLAIIEIVTSTLGGKATTYKERDSWAPRPELGWSPARPGPIHEKKIAANGDVIYDVVNTIDENLMRKVVSADSGPLIAFFGDSFTFGAGVQDADTLPQAFADMTDRKFRVLNLAVTAYGPQQFLRALEIDVHDALLKREPRLFVMLTFPWHSARTSCKSSNAWFGPSYALENGAPVYRGPCSARATGVLGVFHNLFRSTEAYKYIFEPREQAMEPADLDLYIAILIRSGEIARRKYGVSTLILYLPDNLSDARYRLGPGYGNEDIVRRLREGGLQVVDVFIDANAYPGQTLFIQGDGHPTGLAHRIWAGRVKDFVAAELETRSGAAR